MKLYLAGPMSGFENHNFVAFHKAAKLLRNAGHEVLSPAELHPEAEHFGEASGDYKTYLPEDLNALAQCEGIALMGGFAHSNGAIWEVFSALLFGKSCFSIVHRSHTVELRELQTQTLWGLITLQASQNGGGLGKSYQDVYEERRKQDEKWGEQNHSDVWWAAILGEEFGEVSQAILHDEFGGKAAGTVRDELVQLAAVALAWIECIDRRSI